MANKLTLVQVSPPSNPDHNLVAATVSGNYVNGTPDPLPLNAVGDPQIIGAASATGGTSTAVPPRAFGYAEAYYPKVQPIVTDDVITGYGLRWYEENGTELASGAYPAAITGGTLFLDILLDLASQS